MSVTPPLDAAVEARVRQGFAAQRVMETLGARLTGVSCGEVVIELPYDEALTQQDGFLHAGVDVVAHGADGERQVALMQATMMCLRDGR